MLDTERFSDKSSFEVHYMYQKWLKENQDITIISTTLSSDSVFWLLIVTFKK